MGCEPAQEGGWEGAVTGKQADIWMGLTLTPVQGTYPPCPRHGNVLQMRHWYRACGCMQMYPATHTHTHKAHCQCFCPSFCMHFFNTYFTFFPTWMADWMVSAFLSACLPACCVVSMTQPVVDKGGKYHQCIDRISSIFQGKRENFKRCKIIKKRTHID